MAKQKNATGITGQGDAVLGVKPENLRDVICPQCSKPFRLTWNDYSETPHNLILKVYPGGGIYGVHIECPHCDYEEDL